MRRQRDAETEGGDYPQLIDAFKIGIHNWTHANVKAGNLNDLKKGNATQAVGDKVHLNTTPSLGGVPYPGYDTTIGGLVKEDGHSPCIEYRHYEDGVEVSGESDHFEFGSYEGDGGCTPVPKLTSQIGPGRHFREEEPFIQAQYNGGVEVVGPRVGWYAD